MYTYTQLHLEEEQKLHGVYVLSKIRELESQVENVFLPIPVDIILSRLG